MNEPDWENTTEEELWKYVAVNLRKKGIDTVLVGGSVVSIYSSGIFRSGDLDFVNINYQNQSAINNTLNELWFIKKGRHFIHPECKHIFVEFVSPPLSIGSDYNIKPRKILADGITIKILKAADCIKDRLASYIYFDARECLDQALLVALKQPFDLGKLRNGVIMKGKKRRKCLKTFCSYTRKTEHSECIVYSDLSWLIQNLKKQRMKREVHYVQTHGLYSKAELETFCPIWSSFHLFTTPLELRLNLYYSSMRNIIHLM